jgi:hypothetical protein
MVAHTCHPSYKKRPQRGGWLLEAFGRRFFAQAKNKILSEK